LKIYKNDATKATQEVWQRVVLPQDEEEGGIDIIKDMVPPLDTSTIHWRLSKEGITLLELFGGVAIGLAIVLQVGIKVKSYLYVDNGGWAKKVGHTSHREVEEAIFNIIANVCYKRGHLNTALPSDISLISRKEITRHGPVDLVVAGWPCQGLSMASHQNGLLDSRTTRDE
jgi:hypothetical protein